jgi:hypothetical protein
MLPTLIAHADWGTHPAKRWMTQALLQTDGAYLSIMPQKALPPDQFFNSILATIGKQGCALIGFDFPIGLPQFYAKKVGIEYFLPALLEFGTAAWPDFYRPAERPCEIDLQRPFYPNHPGQTSQSQLLNALGADNMDQLRRRCELAYPGRRAAAPLFWTLGAQQVGKAAICAWRDFLAPAKKSGRIPISIWPFEGGLAELLQPGQIVVAETYPGEFYRHLGISFSTHRPGQHSGKRDPSDRKANAPSLLAASRGLNLMLPVELEELILSGFGSSPVSEDQFDTIVGLLGMMKVLRQELPEPDNLSGELISIEGWILGQKFI